MALTVSFILGFVPMLLFAGFINWLDRYEKEPKILLGIVFLWGAIIAAGAAFVINTLIGVGVFYVTGSETAAELATGSVSAPIFEELLKGFAVLLVYLLYRTEFDSILDGIIYAAITALGFAATENVFYIYQYGFLENGWSGLFSVAFIRIVMVGWQHPFFTSFFGIGLAIARLNRNLLVRSLAPVFGLITSVFAHSLHNTLSPSLTQLSGFAGLAMSSMIDWTGWFFMLLFIVWVISQERKLLENHLKEEVENGLITEKQYITAISYRKQSKARTKALFNGNFRATKQFYSLCAELSHKKEQYQRLGNERNNEDIIHSLRERMGKLTDLAISA